MAQPDYASILASLRQQQESNPLSILTLAEPIIDSATNSRAAPAPSPSTQQQRASDASNDNDAANLTPASLSNDLKHYEELFKKLRFSYLEQVTKEKFLRSIVGDPPVLVSHGDNARLEEELVRQKAELKRKKDEVAHLVVDLAEIASRLAARWTGLQTQLSRLEVLPREVEEMQSKVQLMQEELQEKIGGQQQEKQQKTSAGADDPRMTLGVVETDELVKEMQAKTREVERQIAALQRQLPGKMRECEVLERELEALEKTRNEKTAAAREARRVKEEGGRDHVEEMGRWYRSKETVLKGLLDVEVES